MKISIIIPVYNTEKYIRKCIDSCLDQDLDLKEYQIILVDDGSTDNSLRILLEYKEKYNNIIVLTQENKKQGAARNHGLKYALGKYIWFVDSDDWVGVKVLKTLIEHLENNNLDILAIGAIDIDEQGEVISKRKIGYQKNRIYKTKEVLLENKFNVSLPFHIFRKDFLIDNKFQLLENIYFEDVDFMIRVFDVVRSFMYIDFVCYNVLKRHGSATRTTNYLNFFGLIKVIQSMIEYISITSPPIEVQKVFSIRIARCQNSILYGTKDSKEHFQKAASFLKKTEGLKTRLFQSRSLFHIIQFKMLFIPSFLRRLLIIYYK